MEDNKELQRSKIAFNWKNVFMVFATFFVVTSVLFFLMYQKGGTTNTPVSEVKKELVKEDILIGKGAEAVSGKKLTVNYEGKLEDGTKFDSSYDRKKPFEFVLGKGDVIQGWDTGIVGMKVGGKRLLTIPPDLGYGEEGSPPTIPPNSTLIFTVELLKVV